LRGKHYLVFNIEGGLEGFHPSKISSPSPYKERGIQGERLLRIETVIKRG
jgi:hypothetical protein